MVRPLKVRGAGRMSCCSSTAAKTPMAEFLKSQSPQELWKANLQPKDPSAPEGPFEPAGNAQSVKAATAPGTGLLIDRTA